MANEWHSIDRKIYGEGPGPGHFAEAAPEHAEQIVREHNEREVMWNALWKAEIFIAEELGERRASFLPSGNSPIDLTDDCRYVREAVDVLDIVRAALSTQEPKT